MQPDIYAALSRVYPGAVVSQKAVLGCVDSLLLCKVMQISTLLCTQLALTAKSGCLEPY